MKVHSAGRIPGGADEQMKQRLFFGSIDTSAKESSLWLWATRLVGALVLQQQSTKGIYSQASQALFTSTIDAVFCSAFFL
jgi:hypothetical protein